jgi:multiple antibiotic resistance protein
VANDRRDYKPMSWTRSFLVRIAKSYAPNGDLRSMGPLLGCFGYLLGLSTATAAEATAGQTPLSPIPTVQIFTFLFLMLGPIKIIGPFAKITRGAEPGFSLQIALRATLISAAALLFAGIVGESSLTKYGIPLPVLALAGGIILFLVALQTVLEQFTPPAPDEKSAAPTLKMALMPLAFPTIVTPPGIAALIVFLALSPDLEGRLIIGGIVVAIMLSNLIVMLVARYILQYLGVILQVLGAVLGIIQVALGLQIINASLKRLWGF